MHRRKPFQPLTQTAVVITPAISCTTRLEAAEPNGSESEAIDSTNYMCNVRDFGAKGDGRKLDTEAINRAVATCSAQGGGKVLLPPGRYRSGTVHLRSHVTLFLDAGASL